MRSSYPQNCGLVLDKDVNDRLIYLFVECFYPTRFVEESNHFFFLVFETL